MEIPVSLNVWQERLGGPAHPSGASDLFEREWLGSALPFTGFDMRHLVIVALTLLAAGLMLRQVGGTRKGERRTSRRSFVTLGLVLVFLFALPAAAPAEELLVTLDSPAGSRVVYIEDLYGRELDSLNFGMNRTKPFRVRTVDTDMDRSGFSVHASMGNLYLVDGNSYSWSNKVASANMSLSYPQAALNVLNARALVAPVFEAAVSGDAVCGLLGLGSGCLTSDLALADLEGAVRNVPLPVDLGDLSKLPLVPQSGDPGSFVNPHYEGVGAGDPSPGSAAPTKLRVQSGSETTDTSGMVGAVQAALSNEIAGLSAGDLIPEPALVIEIKDAVYEALNVVLTDDQALALVDDVTTQLKSLTIADVLRQSGTYLSYPVMKVDVPNQARGGQYRGTLVMTFVQS